MGDLIAFKLPKKATRRIHAPGRSAAILFFTGVRREIMPDAAPSIRLLRPRKDAGKAPCKSRDQTEAGA